MNIFWLLCKIGKHKLKIIKTFGYESRCVYCFRCKKYFAMNDRVQVFLEWDGEFSQIHNFEPRPNYKVEEMK